MLRRICAPIACACCVVLLTPSWPCQLEPHSYTTPPSVTHSVSSSPADTIAALSSNGWASRPAGKAADLASRRVTPGHARRRRVPPPGRQRRTRSRLGPSDTRVPCCTSALSPRTMSPPRSVRAIQCSPPHASIDMVPALEHFGVVRAWRKPLGQAACAQPPFLSPPGKKDARKFQVSG